jgi:hypothetical protein
MHEMGLAQGIFSTVADMAGERTVTRIVVRVGREQRIASDSLEFSFQLLAEGTQCEGAALTCLVVPGVDVLIDEVELAGDPPAVLRRPGAEVVEPPHAHPHPGDHGAASAPVIPVQAQGGA